MPVKEAKLVLQNNTILVMGSIHFSNAMHFFQHSLPILHHLPAYHFDFSQLITADSSIIAILVEWLKLAKARQCPITIAHLPSDLQTILQIAGVKELIEDSLAKNVSDTNKKIQLEES